jgi:SSS family solute:Na+ symporter
VVCAVVLTYVTYGGMRGTIWVNVFQTLVLLTLGLVAFGTIVGKIGGVGVAMERVAAADPTLLSRAGHIEPWELLTYLFIPLSVGMFPHMFVHWLTARSAASFKPTLIFYPLCVALVWAPSVILGVLARADFPDLGPAAASSVLVKMIDLYAPGVLSGLLAAGVWAAIMNSFDSQVLSVGTMFTQDIVRHYGFEDRMSERQQITVGRLFTVGILVVTFLLSLVMDRSLFKLGVWCFTGFAALLPVVVAAIFWKRSTKWGAFASTISVVVLWTFFVIRGWESPNYTIAGTGIMPVGVIFLVSAAAMILGSLLTRPPGRATIDKFFPREGAV